MIADSSKPNKLRNVYTIRSTARNVTVQIRKIYYIKIKVIALIILEETHVMNVFVGISPDCKSAKTIKNGEVTFGNHTTYGELAKVTCDFGYRVKGHPYLVCQADGKWTSNTTCEKVGKTSIKYS